MPAGPVVHERRRPESTVLHTVVRDHLESFLEDARARTSHGYGVPRHVERELRGDLRCGVLAHGFVRVRCTGCGLDRLVAFSCKGRAVCPSCRGRRMADVAAHLVDRVLPARYRQWTLSVPWRWRLALARDRRLLSRALDRLRPRRLPLAAAACPRPRCGRCRARRRHGRPAVAEI